MGFLEWGYPKMENHMKIDDLGVPPYFRKPPNQKLANFRSTLSNLVLNWVKLSR